MCPVWRRDPYRSLAPVKLEGAKGTLADHGKREFFGRTCAHEKKKCLRNPSRKKLKLKKKNCSISESALQKIPSPPFYTCFSLSEFKESLLKEIQVSPLELK